jgi:glycerol-3-phosphate O-acyltransferase
MYTFFGVPFRTLMWFFWPLVLILKIVIQPTGVTRRRFREVIGERDVIYVLPRMSVVDIFVLNLALRRLRMPRVKFAARPHAERSAAVLAMKPPVRITPWESNDSFVTSLAEILKHDERSQRSALVLQPVSVFWGRVPERSDRNILSRILFPDDGRANAVQKIWIVLAQCRNVHVHFSSLVEIGPSVTPPSDETSQPTRSKDQAPETQWALRLRRLLTIEFSRERAASLGPSLYDFGAMAEQIINAPSTRQIISSAPNPAEAEVEAVRYLSEITSDYNYITVEAFARLLDFVWMKIFRGIRVRNFDKVAQFAKAGQVIWMPCHRSHLDYLLLSYVLKRRGLAIPHIAAGKNLDFWPIGPVLRRSGAFFIRRSFQGNRLYSHIFSMYTNFIMHNGFAIEFFQEGGRTRIGKLLPPKRGMLSVCVASAMRRKAENTYIVPVFFGYEKVLEDESYASELLGAKKQKETIWQFALSLRKLFSNYGRVDVSFGEPLHLGTEWQRYFERFPDGKVAPLLREISDDLESRERPIQDFSKNLGKRVNMGINAAATASGSALTAAILLGHPEQEITKLRLRSKLKVLHWTVGQVRKALDWSIATSAGVESANDFLIEMVGGVVPPPPSAMRLPESSMGEPVVSTLPFQPSENPASYFDEILSDAEGWEFIVPKERRNEDDEPAYLRHAQKEMNLWWYRGTVFHILAIPGLVATALLDLPENSRTVEAISGWLERIRALWDEELYWHDDVSTARMVRAGLAVLSGLAVCDVDESGTICLKDDEDAMDHLYFYADLVRPEREMYSIQVNAALALMETRGRFTSEQLLQRSVQAHRAAFLRGAAVQPANLSQVFGRRVFEALVHVDLFTADGQNGFVILPQKLESMNDFFEVSVWRDFCSQ